MQLHDNSFLTHLATGRLILHSGIPRHDPYSFTAHGHPWVVQSWLASLLYGLADKWWGGHGLIVLHAALAFALTVTVWRLTSPARSLAARIVAAVPAVLVGSVVWSERPQLFAFLLLALLVLVVERRWTPWWLLPIGWLWVNVHGSFPFAVAYLVVRLVGAVLDRDAGLEERRALVRYLGFAVGGILLGAVNPLGPTLLFFPLHLLGNNDVLKHVVEWGSPSFSSTENLVFLAMVLGTLLLLARRPSWRDALPMALFAALGFVALRNIPLAMIVMTPVLARSLPALGNVRSDQASPVAAPGVAVLGVLGLLLAATSLTRPPFRMDAYPVAELSWAQDNGLLDRRLATEDFVGNYISLREGPTGKVFFDDRFDMYPVAFSQAAFDLHEGAENWQQTMDRYHVGAVLWSRGAPLATVLEASPDWRLVHETKKYIVVVRANAPGPPAVPHVPKP